MAHCAYIRLRSAGKKYLLICILGIYFTVHHAQAFGWGGTLFRFYIKDILIVPLVLTATGITMSLLNKEYHPGIKEVVAAVIYISLVFEILLPAFGTKFETDLMDVICYGIGGILYFTLFRDAHLIYES